LLPTALRQGSRSPTEPALGEDWRYAEFAEGGFVLRVGDADTGLRAPPQAASAAASVPAR